MHINVQGINKHVHIYKTNIPNGYAKITNNIIEYFWIVICAIWKYIIVFCTRQTDDLSSFLDYKFIILMLLNHVTLSLSPKHLILTTLNAQFLCILRTGIPTTVLLPEQCNIISWTGKINGIKSEYTVLCYILFPSKFYCNKKLTI